MLYEDNSVKRLLLHKINILLSFRSFQKHHISPIFFNYGQRKSKTLNLYEVIFLCNMYYFFATKIHFL